MASVTLNHIYKVYPNGLKAVNDFSMDIADGEFIVFVGPSGCGKSTTLRMIAGLEEVTAGELRIDGEFVNYVEPKERDIAMVFQNYALYPHMTVYNNMAFGLELRRVSKDEIKKRVHSAARILGITEYLQKKPKEMSGGQRQRVALGRAMVRNPKVMLLDEPLSNLDAKLRTQMRSEILKLHDRLKTTFIYVTHDQVEAMTMGTRIVVMKDGFVQQIDTPRNLYSYPCNKFVAGFIGTPQMNFYSGNIRRVGDNVELALDNTDIVFTAPYELFAKTDSVYLDGSKKVIFGIRSEHISIDPDKYPFKAKCKVSYCEDLGVDSQVYGNFDLNYVDLIEPEEYSVPDEETMPKKKKRGKKNGPEESKQEETNESATRVVIKAPAATKIDRDTIIEVSLDLSNMQIFDAETEQSVVPRIPSHYTIGCSVKDGVMTVLGSEFKLPPAVSLDDGEYTMDADRSALSVGTGLKAEFLDKEVVDGVTLNRFRAGDTILYVASDGKVGKPKGISIDFKHCSFVRDGEIAIGAMPEQNSLECVLTKFVEPTRQEIDGVTKEVKVKRYKLNFAVYPETIVGKDGASISDERTIAEQFRSKSVPITSHSIVCNDDDAQKILIGAGRAVYKDTLEAQFSPFDVALGEGLDGTVETVLDYGEEKFAKCLVGNTPVYVKVEDGFDQTSVKLSPNVNAIKVYDKTIDIRLV